MIEIYTDGGCRTNPGPGAWAYVVKGHDDTLLYADPAPKARTTNNEMELTAIIKALEWVSHNASWEAVTIYSDSQYAVNAVNEWYANWKKSGTLSKKKNIPLIERILELKTPAITLKWVRGHADCLYNNLADRLVNQAINEFLTGKQQ